MVLDIIRRPDNFRHHRYGKTVHNSQYCHGSSEDTKHTRDDASLRGCCGNFAQACKVQLSALSFAPTRFDMLGKYRVSGGDTASGGRHSLQDVVDSGEYSSD